MKYILIAHLILGLGAFCQTSQQTEAQPMYLKQAFPNIQPVLFAPGTVSKRDRHEFGSVFTRDGLTLYYGVDTGGKAQIHSMTWNGNNWEDKGIVVHHSLYSYNDPFLSPDHTRLYFISDQPAGATGEKKDYDILYVEKSGTGWSEPISAGPSINTSREEYYMSFTNDGTMYFSSNVAADEENTHNFDIYAAPYQNGEFQKPIRLGDTVNTNEYEADVFVAHDGSYLIFCGIRKGGLGRGDLYISFRNPDESWTKAKNMGAPINSDGHELCPFVTYDGRYLFYTSRGDIYWVSTKILEPMRPKSTAN